MMTRTGMTRNGLLRATALLVAVGAALLVVLGLLGGHAYRLDAFAAFRWHASASAVLAVLVALWPRRALLLAILAPFIVLGLPILAAHSVSSTGTANATSSPAGAKETRTSLRVMTFNTWDQTRNIDEVHELLRRTAPDVVVLVEVSPPKRALLEVLKPLYPYQVQCAERWPCSMALISRIPFEAQGTFMPNAERPSAVWGRIADSGDGLTIIGVHIHRPTRSPRIHWGHMRGLADMMKSAKGDFIVAGDFNTPSWSASMQWLHGETGLQPMPRVLPTWPAWPVVVPQFPIDHILISRGLRLDQLSTEAAAASDHLPVIGTVTTIRPLLIGPGDAAHSPRKQAHKAL
jgi:endonuclease/exonuclease/phosphatase (EEP) superfamily protein YafD